MPAQPLSSCARRTRCQDFTRVLLLVLVPLMAMLARPAGIARAEEPLCFPEQAPAVTACLSGPFRAFWEAHGGSRVFGYPLTDAAAQTTANGTFITQYFERARFELHPENAPPYAVLLGRLGAEQLSLNSAERGVPGDATDGACQLWGETERSVCGPFLATWQSNGIQLDDDPAINDAERMALWGLPLTNVLVTLSETGTLRTQWFERARFEQQADGSITVGRLGSELLDQPAQTPPEPTPVVPAEPAQPVAPPVPSVPFPSIPCNANVPTPAEGLQVWMADPNPPREADAVACVRLILGGEAINGANAIVYRYIGSERRPSIPQSTGMDGVASFIFYIRDLPVGAATPIEALVTYRGITYVAYTELLPR